MKKTVLYWVYYLGAISLAYYFFLYVQDLMRWLQYSFDGGIVEGVVLFSLLVNVVAIERLFTLIALPKLEESYWESKLGPVYGYGDYLENFYREIESRWLLDYERRKLISKTIGVWSKTERWGVVDPKAMPPNFGRSDYEDYVKRYGKHWEKYL